MSRSKYSSFWTFSVVSGTSSTIIKRIRPVPLFHAGCIVTYLFWRLAATYPTTHSFLTIGAQTRGRRTHGKHSFPHQTPGNFLSRGQRLHAAPTLITETLGSGTQSD